MRPVIRIRAAHAISLALSVFGFFILASCRSETALDTPTDELDVSNLQISVASSDFSGDQPRVPILIYDGPDRVADALIIRVTAFDLSKEPPIQVWAGEAFNFSDFEVPYWVLYPQVPSPGFYGIRAEITLHDGSLAQSEFAIEIGAQSSSPAVGTRSPSSNNQTLNSEPDITKISSDPEPNPDFYQMTVAEAVESGKPTIVAFSTPAFCTSQLCGPVLESIEALFDQMKDKVNFIHIEIYKDFDTFEIVKEVGEWGLTSEPWTFVIDSSGLIYAKFGGPLSVDELSRSLNELLP